MKTTTNDLIKSILAWWEAHQYDTISLGDGEEDNVFDEEPEFVTIAKEIKDSSMSHAGNFLTHLQETKTDNHMKTIAKLEDKLHALRQQLKATKDPDELG